MIVNNDVFIELVLKSVDDIDFPELGNYVLNIFSHSVIPGQNMRMLMALVELDKCALAAQRKVTLLILACCYTKLITFIFKIAMQRQQD